VSLLVQNYPEFAFRAAGVEARFLPFDPKIAFLDLRFLATETKSGLLLECEANTDLFEPATVDLLLAAFRDVLEPLVANPAREVSRFTIPEELQSAGAKETLSVAATFTSEPIQKPLEFWMKQLGIEGAVKFAPFNQVFQQLLDPSSLLSSNADGVNL